MQQYLCNVKLWRPIFTYKIFEVVCSCCTLKRICFYQWDYYCYCII